MRNAVIASTGAYLPKRVLTNAYFDQMLGLDVSTWLENNLNIYERRWCSDDESTVDLAEHAARQALDRAGLEPRDLDLIVVATDTPEYLTPSTAAVVQYRLQAGHAGTFDLNAACAGFVMGLDVACKYIRTDARYNNVMVIGAYAMSKFLNQQDKKTVTLFADGAGAIILQAEETGTRGYQESELITLGQYYDGMGIYGIGTKHPLTEDSFRHKEHTLRINYRFPPELNPQVWTRMAKDMQKRMEVKPDEIAQYFLTQININSIRKTMENMKLDESFAHTSMQYYGYTGSACLPIVFNDAVEKGKLQPNDRFIMIGSGSGLTFGGISFVY